MDKLLNLSLTKINATAPTFVRDSIVWLEQKARLIGIKGQRGVGKTTLLLQYLKCQPDYHTHALYISADNLWFANHSIYELAEAFSMRGGKILAIDEVHKYTNWASELKLIYDDFPSLKVVFTGSSLLEILNARADLSRRAIVHTMQGFSFREFLSVETDLRLPALQLTDILKNHISLARDIIRQIKVFAYFDKYLKYGYYPFYLESDLLYEHKLQEIINMILEVELPLLHNIDLTYSQKLKQLLIILAETVPFVPNLTKLSERIGISRNTFMHYIYYLNEACLLNNIYKIGQGISKLQKTG